MDNQNTLSPQESSSAHASKPQISANAHDELLKRLEGLLRNKKQAILTGPPGTGKTYLAKELAAGMIGIRPDDLENSEQYQFRQFHPGYDYSDFVEGLKPKISQNGTPVFERTEGVFMDFCNRAKKALGKADANSNPNEVCDEPPYIMVIDEINRADLSRVFGELFYGLEKDYRGEIIPTQYDYLPYGDSDNQDLADFSIPPNVYIIGTMNDIDRSVESMDFALRRRFAWQEITIEDSKVILEKCIKNSALREFTIQLMERVNKEIVNGMLNLGNEYCLGAAYFKDEYSRDNLWNYQLSPILNEYRRSCRQRSIELEDLKTEYERIYDEICGKNKDIIERYNHRFDWVGIYEKIADAILGYKDKNKREELLKITKKVIEVTHASLKGIENLTGGIDPFSVMNILNLNMGHDEEKKKRNERIKALCNKLFGIDTGKLKNLKEKLELFKKEQRKVLDEMEAFDPKKTDDWTEKEEALLGTLATREQDLAQMLKTAFSDLSKCQNQDFSNSAMADEFSELFEQLQKAGDALKAKKVEIATLAEDTAVAVAESVAANLERWPEDFIPLDGIPTVYNGLYDFFNYKSDKGFDACDTFWEYFENAIAFADNMKESTREKFLKSKFLKSFDKVKTFKIRNRMPQEFVNVLYRIRPRFYVPLDGNTQGYIMNHKAELDLDIKRSDLSISKLTGERYLEICSIVRDNLAKLDCESIMDFSMKAYDAGQKAQQSDDTNTKMK